MRVLWIYFTLLISQVIGQGTFTNPLKKKDGSDPWITYHDGFYYLLTTTWNDVQLVRAKTLNGLKSGERRVVYKESGGNRCCNVWAPGKTWRRDIFVSGLKRVRTSPAGW
jgi:GH43 family beta-xylosidase